MIATKIKEIIIQKQMAPGERLPSEKEWIEKFGVSRATIRESMKILKAENVIEIQRGNGTFVSEFLGVGDDPLGLGFANKDQVVRDLLEARLLFEPQITMLAAQNVKPSNIEQLELIMKRFEAEEQSNEVTMELDVEFHTAIASCTQNDILIRIAPIINDSIRQGYTETNQVSGSLERAKHCHLNMIRAIKEGNLFDAEYYAKRHIRETLNDLMKMEEKK